MLDPGCGPIFTNEEEKRVAKKDILGVESGILQPSLMRQFRVEIFGDVSEKVSEMFALQVISVSLNYSDKEGTIILEHPEDGHDLHEFLLKWNNQEISSMNITFLGREEEIKDVVCLEKVECLTHTTCLDYASSDAVHHSIDFMFSDITLISPKEYDHFKSNR